jgi:coenzyme F420 hydrogenase subunit beta
VGKNKTILPVVKSGLCTGCGTCTGICPRNAIRMVIDKSRGIYIPQLDVERCNECGLCFEACPGHSVDFHQLNLDIFGKEPEDVLLGNYLNCYIGHANDENIRFNSASGGMITALLLFALKEGLINGVLVTGMNKDRPLEPEPFVARTKEEIMSAAKSKYCPVPANIALREILDSKDGERFAVVGLSCHIQGIRKSAAVNKKLKDRIAWYFGLLCNHTPTFLATEYLLCLARVKGEDISELHYRGEGWPGKMRIGVKGRDDVLLPFVEYWDKGFGHFFRPGRCLLCPDHGNELADISFGDPWGIEGDDSSGESMAITRSGPGEELLQEAAKEDIELRLIDRARVRGVGLREGIEANLSLSKTLGKRVPYYNRKLPKPVLSAYVKTVSGYLRAYLGTNRFLWPLLPHLPSLGRLLPIRKFIK